MFIIYYVFHTFLQHILILDYLLTRRLGSYKINNQFVDNSSGFHHRQLYCLCFHLDPGLFWEINDEAMTRNDACNDVIDHRNRTGRQVFHKVHAPLKL